MARVAVATLGCKVNQVESESIKEELIARGFDIVDFAGIADIYIINTCTVTHTSDRKSRAMIRRARRRNPDAAVIAVGCLTRVDEEQLSAMKSVDLILQDKDQILEWVEKLLAQSHEPLPRIAGYDAGISTLKPVIYAQRHERTRAFVKIEDGCEAFCSYCIVPYARGRVRSKKPDDVMIEIESLANLGYREIVLTGIHTGAYGKDLHSATFAGLVGRIAHEAVGEYRIRLSSIEPLEVSEQLITIIRDSNRICRHLHIPLQSGSDQILYLMNRKYRRDLYSSLIGSLAHQIPGIAVTTDVMVGFPGESESDFSDTCDLIKRLPIAGMHVFKYSSRKGTPAAQYPGQVPEEEKHERSKILLGLSIEKSKEFMLSQIGQELEVLIERPSARGGARALSDNYLQLEIPGAKALQGSLRTATVTSPGQGVLLSTLNG